MSFREFVCLFDKLEAPLGDLARDILEDRDFDDTWPPEKIRQYLEFRLGCDDRVNMVSALLDLFAVL